MTKYIERYKEISRRIVYYRNKRGISQEELAYRIGISTSYLTKIEAPNSQKQFSLDVLFAIADGLDIDVVNFFKPIEEIEK
jgi:transcriptional regulator with XRE-family HTH domain